jgi:regulator of RNase E activity RraA
MTTDTFDAALLALLRKIDTPTVCNAIEVAEGKRGFARFTRRTVIAAAPKLPAMVGFARTARIRGVKPSDESPDVVRARRMAYYKYMAEGPRPSLAVVEDLDYPECIAAFWGEINTVVHKGLGLGGVLTNGVMRDLGDLAPEFQVVAGSIGPSHGFVHVVDFDTPVNLFGLDILPGELVHADRHGAVVVPKAVIPWLKESVANLLASERIILDAARRPDFNFIEFEAVWSAFEKSRI